MFVGHLVLGDDPDIVLFLPYKPMEQECFFPAEILIAVKMLTKFAGDPRTTCAYTPCIQPRNPEKFKCPSTTQPYHPSLAVWNIGANSSTIEETLSLLQLTCVEDPQNLCVPSEYSYVNISLWKRAVLVVNNT